MPYCVIGAGPCGLAAAKNLRRQGIEFDLYERQGDLGGNWNIGLNGSSVYQTTHLISSKTLTQFDDFPMPEHYPDFPHHSQVLEYLRNYAEHFDLRRHIRFNSPIEHAHPLGDSGWEIKPQNKAPVRYDGLIIANGHHWDPAYPSFPGSFAGEILHTHDYKTAEVFAGKRVLIVGAGNSGCDVSVEAARAAKATFHSFRRGYHFLPKFLRGKPIDVCGERLHRWRLPLALRRAIAQIMVHIALGRPERFGLPRPDHRLFETHPIVNSQLLYELGHGRIQVKPNVAELKGDRVRFVDGSEELIDLLVYATGYKLSFPFLDSNLITNENGRPKLFLNAFHPERDDLFVSGMIQPDSGIWGLADLQCRIMAAYLRGRRESPEKVRWFRELKSRGAEDLGHGVQYVPTPRHYLEVEYFSYRERLRKLIQRFGSLIPSTSP